MLTRENLPEKVTSHLRRRILLGEFPTGHHLSEVSLSEELQVSRGSVRSGIRSLENEGLVETPANGRTLVFGLSQKDLKDLFEARWRLEAAAIRAIVDQGLNKDLSRVDEIVGRMESEQELSNLIELDIEFHYRLVEASQNRTLIKLWSTLRGLIGTLIEICSDFYKRLGKVTEVHLSVLRAVKEGQADWAIELLREHLDTGEALISDHLSRVAHEAS